MTKPLLHTIPTLSGNVKLECRLCDYVKKDNTEYDAYVRYADLMPLHASKSEYKCEAGLLNSSWEFDIKDYYRRYSDIFYSTCYDIDTNDYIKIDRHNEQYPRNIHFEMGCRRIGYQKSGNQFSFYAPLWIDSVNDIPDYFVINIRIHNNLYNTERHIKVNIKNNDDYKYNYLDKYLSKYLSKIDGTCIYCMPSSKQATYYGIDVVKGGFKKAVDNIFHKNYSKQSTINNFDAVISNGWKRNLLIMKQVIPLSFSFNLNDILSANDIKKFADAELIFEGFYCKDGKEIPFYDFSIDYTEFYQDVYALDKNKGIIGYAKSLNNIMNIQFPALNDGYYEGYRYSNKLAPVYNRWKLKYSDDVHPYITNMSWAFSSLQDSSYKYGLFPESYKPIKIVSDEENNLILPLGNAIKSEKSPYFNDYNLQKNYSTIINNHAVSWFDVITDIDEYEQISVSDPENIISTNIYYKYEDGHYIKYSDDEIAEIKRRFGLKGKNPDRIRRITMYVNNSIFSKDSWVNVEDNKAFYKGILYDLSNIYKIDPSIKPIDKFNVFVRINFIKIPYEDLKSLKSAKYSIFENSEYSLKNNCIVSDSIWNQMNDGMITSNMTSLYLNEDGKSRIYKNTIDFDSLYIENKEGTGAFIDPINYGFDLYDVNRYYKLSEIIYKLKNDPELEFDRNPEQVFNNHLFADYIIDGDEFLPIYRLNEVYDRNNRMLFKNEYQEHGYWITESMMFSQGSNFNKTDFENASLKSLNIEKGNEHLAVPLYTKAKFVSYFSLRTIMNETLSKKSDPDKGTRWIDKHISAFDEYEFHPLLEWNDEPYAQNVFVRRDTCIGHKYGDYIPHKSISKDKDLIYVDPYNINNVIEKWNSLHAKGDVQKLPLYTDKAPYDYDISDYYEPLRKLAKKTDVLKFMLDEIHVNVTEDMVSELPSKLRCVSLDWRYILLNVYKNTMLPLYYRDINPETGELYNLDGKSESFKNDCIYTFNDSYGSTLVMEDVDVDKYETLNDNNSAEFYAKILDKGFLHWYLAELYNNFNLTENEDMSINSLYVKKRMIVNDYKIKTLYVKDVYLPITDFYSPYKALSNEQKIDMLENGVRNIYTYKKTDKQYNKEAFVMEDFNSTDYYWLDESPYSDTYMQYLPLTDEMKADIVKGTHSYKTFVIDKNGQFKEVDYLTYEEYYIDITQTEDGKIIFEDDYNKWIKDIKTNLFDDLSFNDELSYWTFNDNFNLWNDVDVLAGIPEQDNSKHSDFKFELYYKKRFLKLSKNLYNLLNIDIDDKRPFKDLYLYQVYKPEEYPERLKYYYTENLDIDAVEMTMALKPLFDSVYMQNKTQTVIYKEFNQSRIIPTTYAMYTGKNPSLGIYSGLSKEEVEQATGQTAIELKCPYNTPAHSMWYSGMPEDDNGIHVPSEYSYYYRYNSDNTVWMLDMTKIQNRYGESFYPIRGLNSVTGLPANFWPISYFEDGRVNENGMIDYNGELCYAYLIKTYDLVNNCYSKLSLASSYTPEKVSYIQSTNYIDNPEELTVYSYYSRSEFDDIFGPWYNISYEINGDIVTQWSTVNVSKTEEVNTYYTYYVNNKTEFDELNAYNTFLLNTYTIDGTTYGFFVIDAYFDNTSSSFNLVDTNYYTKKYFTYINENFIYNKDYNVADTFNLIVPASNLNLKKTLFNQNSVPQKPSILSFSSYYRQKPLTTENGEMYAYDIQYRNVPYGTVTLERYFDSIVPYIPQTSDMNNSYNLKYKNMDSTIPISYTNDIMYKTHMNIYSFTPLRVYNADGTYEEYEPVEYQYFNASKLINLEEHFEIFVGESLTYDEIMKLEEDKVVIEAFKNYINRDNRNSFNDDEILFLYNKYKVEYDSVCTGINTSRTAKLYKLTYKFNLL